jgi:hypothetical protein
MRELEIRTGSMLNGELPLRDFNIISLIWKGMAILLGSVSKYIMCVVYSIKDRKTWNNGGKDGTGKELCTLNADTAINTAAEMYYKVQVM